MCDLCNFPFTLNASLIASEEAVTDTCIYSDSSLISDRKLSHAISLTTPGSLKTPPQVCDANEESQPCGACFDRRLFTCAHLFCDSKRWTG